MKIEKYSFGHGDRFHRQGRAQLRAVLMAREGGAEVVPVWNKSHREHQTVGSHPAQLRQEADQAVSALGYSGSYYLDADHINLQIVDQYLETHSFFTLDMTQYIGKSTEPGELNAFADSLDLYLGALELEGLDRPVVLSKEVVLKTAGNFLLAMREAGRLYRHIAEKKGAEQFVTEISIDETDSPQTPDELFVILAAIAQNNIPAQTIAPKFSGRFNKGVDYEGAVEQFEREFHSDLAVIRFAVQEFGLPENLKLSVHSGSDKFSLYPAIRRALVKFDAGLHIKTAGTTWLEELIGLAEAEGPGLELAKQIYGQAWAKREELCAPYLAVIDINPARLPAPAIVREWDGQKFARTLRHDTSCADYNGSFRQLLHVGYKIAAQLGERYYQTVEENETDVSRNVTRNLFERHLKPLFLGTANNVHVKEDDALVAEGSNIERRSS